MKTRWIAFLMILCLLAQGGLVLRAFSNVPDGQLDLVDVNEAVQNVASNWEGLIRGKELPSLTCDLNYVVVNNDGTVLAATKENLSSNIDLAVVNRDTILDIRVNNETEGKIFIYNDRMQRKREAVNEAVIVSVIFMAIECFLFFYFILYVNASIFKPFKKLKTFAVQVAEGNLDFPLFMDKGNAFGAFTESFDLMREELKKAHVKEQAAVKSKKELVAKLSHDIKTPVASIKTVAELMSVTAGSEKERKQLAIISDKADQIDSLISDLFHAALEQMQQLTVAPMQISSRILPDMIAAADYLGRAQVKEVPDCLLVFDRMRLQQVFDNIITNSYKYANSKILVTCSITDRYFCIRIKDFGEGVAEDELSLLFEKFYRGKNGKNKSGSGLGLFISRYLLAQMEGEIECQNTWDGFVTEVRIKVS